MNRDQRITAFHNLGTFLDTLPSPQFQSLADLARQHNPWFTEQSIQMSVRGIRKFLYRETLEAWLSPYPLPPAERTIGVVMAGNVPMVGFHDLLSVLIAGHNILIKESAKDSVLMHFITDALMTIEPQFRQAIRFADRLKNFDGIIATGSDNASRYFEYYFSRHPHIIRKNRTSVAILDGQESTDELMLLGEDIFSYFGLGCRNVSKLFLPEGYSPEKLFSGWEAFKEIIHHHKFHNNYDYQKSLLLINQKHFLDNGFLLLEENDKLVSPIAVVYYGFYKDPASLTNQLAEIRDKTQCVVGTDNGAAVPFGQAQYPAVTDYADDVDTLRFLTTLN